jgi:hypothetical protein
MAIIRTGTMVNLAISRATGLPHLGATIPWLAIDTRVTAIQMLGSAHSSSL